ncbi:hypothetical protein Cni_G27405 [Canna indica]|uniref:ZCF37 n=1 Tax=Canna indica TaxID=4628 RepID=A0AAQ3L4V2_9LILI|nr:hypothetical protein Cni_G27405 [Canna indica]
MAHIFDRSNQTTPAKTMFCGASSLKNIDDSDEPQSPASPRSKKKASKNPYSTRGLDKYSTVLGELEHRRTKIMEKAGAGVSTVKFVYSDSSDWIPVVVRQRNQKEDDHTTTKTTKVSGPIKQQPAVISATEEGGKRLGTTEKKSWGCGFREVIKGWKWRSYYWGLVMVLALLCSVMFGRVFAICCVLIWWYLVPMVHGEDWGVGRSIKGYGRRMKNNRWITATSHSSLSKKN